MTQEPTRLVDDGAVPEGVRRHLREAAAEPWASVDTERGYAKLCAAIATEAALTTAAASAGKSAWKLWALGGAGGALGALAVGGALLGPAERGASLPAPPPAAVAARAEAAGGDAVVAAAPEAAPSGADAAIAPGPAAAPAHVADAADAATPEAARASGATDAATPEAARGGGTANAPSARKGAPNAAALADEVAHLARARALAASDPAAALRLADEGHRSFSRGVLYPEREALAIDCLRRSGRRGEAQARAQRFVKRFPRSPFAEKMRRENGLEASTDR